MIEIRTCIKCVIPKPLLRFRYDKPSGNYRRGCKDCESDYNRKRITSKSRDRTYMREAMRRYRDRLRQRGIIKSSERRRSPQPKAQRLRTIPRVRLTIDEAKKREAERKRSLHSRMLSKLRKYRRKHASGSFTKLDVEKLLRLQENRCAYCGRRLRGFHIDHVVPLAKNGTNNPSNLLLTCEHCNKSKGTKTLDQWQANRRFTLLPFTGI